jgi:hypothetical protein
MKHARRFDPIAVLAEANPVRVDDQTQLRERSTRREQILALIRAKQTVEPGVPLRRTWSRRPMLIAGFLAAALLITGVAIADGVNPFAGIGAADRAQTPQDLLSPVLIQHVDYHLARFPALTGLPAPQLVPDSARLLSQLPSGTSIYVIATTTDALCVVTETLPAQGGTRSFACGNPDSQTQPTTIESQDEVVNGPNATQPLTLGVAQDNVAAVSFMPTGQSKRFRSKTTCGLTKAITTRSSHSLSTTPTVQRRCWLTLSVRRGLASGSPRR